MHQLTALGLIDVLALLIVAFAIVGSLRRRAGLLGALGSALGAALLVWLLLGAAVSWGSPNLASAARASRVATLVPLPQRAFHQVGQLLDVPPSQPSERTP